VHAAMQADELGIRKLIVPKASPAFSALGLLIADAVIDTQRSYITPSSRAESGRVNELFQEMEDASTRDLAAAGLGRSDLVFHRSLAICYPGQTFDMSVPAITSDGRMSDAELARTVESFHDLHEELHTYASRDEEPVLRAVRVQTIGQTEKPRLREYEQTSERVESALRSRRPAWFGGRFVETPVYDGDRLGFGHRLEGPAVVEERFTTIVIYPEQTAEIDRNGNYVIELP
jgi:N-methylhydantoinase A